MIPRTPPGRRSVTNASLSRRHRSATRSDATLAVASNAISRLDYNPDEQSLTVTFARDGSQYTIPGITEIEAHRMASSGSPGKYFNAHVRGRY
jgi:hypothetical protein